ncbi:hypothetical protein Dxin01_01210 [Deinococcus xinjiangensis]|uniref:Uncharacterized protein n=1 Tax=Deinococcus xinjiangensis TaxID=457454 RepID=A0ABP9V871_9DEIO
MPKLIAFGTLGMLAVSAGLYAVAQQTGPTLQLQVQTKGSEVNCVKPEVTQPNQSLLFKTSSWNCYQNDSKTLEGVYMSFSEIQRTLQPLGFKVELKDGLITFYYNPMKKQIAETYINFRQGGESYLDASDMLSMVMNGFPVQTHLHDYDHPTVTVGKLSNLVLTGQTPNFGEQVYRTTGQTVGYHIFDFTMQGKYKSFLAKFDKPEATAPVQTIHTTNGAGEVIAAYRWIDSAPTVHPNGGSEYLLSKLTLDIGVTDAQGNVSLHIPDGATFVNKPPTRPSNDILLVKLTNTPLQNIKSGIFLPKQ